MRSAAQTQLERRAQGRSGGRLTHLNLALLLSKQQGVSQGEAPLCVSVVHLKRTQVQSRSGEARRYQPLLCNLSGPPMGSASGSLEMTIVGS